MDPQKWIQENNPNCRLLDHDLTMERYNYPKEVRNWIKDNWIKVNDENGGTYHEPEYHKKRTQKQQPLPHQQEQKHVENIEEGEEKDENNGKAFAQEYKKTPFYDAMDNANKKGIDVMASQGMETAVKHMFTDQKTGRTLSYGEMRTRYG